MPDPTLWDGFGRGTFQRITASLDNVWERRGRSFTGLVDAGPERTPTPEAPKIPRLVLGLHNFSTTRLVIPHLDRTAPSSPVVASPVAVERPSTPMALGPTNPNSYPQHIHIQTASGPISHSRHLSAERFAGVDPADARLAALAESGRRRRRKKKRRSSSRGCAPRIRNRRIRGKILACIISGLVGLRRQLIV